MGKQNTAVSDEQIIAALLTSRTIKAAAAEVGLSQWSIAERMKDDGFRELYENAKTDLLRDAVFTMSGKLTAAIETVAEIMQNEEVNPATRLQAAQTIIGNATKISDQLRGNEYQIRMISKYPNAGRGSSFSAISALGLR